MKISTFFLVRKVSLMLSLLLLTGIAYGAVFTATASGNFSSSATWAGGIVPPATVSVDVIIIPAGVNVNLDEHLVLNGMTAQLNVAGSLTTSNSSSLTLNLGTFSGTGDITLDRVTLHAGGTFVFAGNMTTKTLEVNADVAATTNILVEENLKLLSGNLSLVNTGNLDLHTGATIIVSGGTLSTSLGGTIDLSSVYKVMYTGMSTTAGMELSGSGLKDVSISVDDGNTVTLTSDLTVAGKLELTSGTFVLGANDLIVNGDVEASGTGRIYSTSTSDVTINSTSGMTDAMTFASGSFVKDLMINVGNNAEAKISGDVSVSNTLILNSGVLAMEDVNFKILGDVAGAGALRANASTDLSINTTSSLSTPLKFTTGGQTINNLTVSVGSGNTVSLGSDLTVKSILMLSEGSRLQLNGNELTLDADAGIAGTGMLSTDADASLILKSTTGVSTISMLGTIGSLILDADESTTVRLGSDAHVSGMLSLQKGTLMLNDHDLTVMGDVTASIDGKISSTATSDITIHSTNTMTDALNFEFGSAVNDFAIITGIDSQTKISGDLSVMNDLKLNGTLKLEDASLSIHGDVTGTGFLSSTATSDITVNVAGGLTESLKFIAGGQTVNNLSVSLGAGNTLMMGSDLKVEGALSLMEGSLLALNGKTLTLGAGSSLTGTGSLAVDPAASLTIDATAGISLLKMDGTLGSFTINTSENAVVLADNTTIGTMLDLKSGVLMVSDNDLTIMGDIAAGGSGRILSTSLSDISIHTTTGTAGALDFMLGSSVNDLLINAGAEYQVRISGMLTVMNDLKLIGGTLTLDNAHLTISGDLTGSGFLSSTHNSDITINTAGGLTETIKFATGGQTINNFSLATGAGGTVMMGSDLTVEGALSLTDESVLMLNSKSLTLGTESSLTGSGFLSVDPYSSLTIDAASGISALKLDGSLGILTINTTSAEVVLDSDATVSNMLSLQSGELKLNGFDLLINGNIAASGTGTISSGADSDVTIASATSLSGALRFAPYANVVGDFTINIADQGTATVSSDMRIDKSLTLTSGKLNIGAQALVMSPTSTIAGAGTTTYVQTAAGGFVEMDVTAGSAAKVMFPVGTPTAYTPAFVSLDPASSSGKIQIGVTADVLAEGTSGSDLSATQSMVDATWHINSDISSNADMDLQLMWPAAMEVNGFANSEAFISQYVNGSWDSSASLAATAEPNGMFSIQREGITSFSSFAVFDRNTVTAIEDISDNNQISVYPNPSFDVITIENKTSSAAPVQMDIYSSTGQLQGRYRLSDAISNVSVKELMNGNYFIRLYNDEMSSTRHITKM